MEPYYFKTKLQESKEYCIEPCNVKNDGTHIGSIKCQVCEFNLDNNSDKDDLPYVRCTKINEAIKQ